MQIQIIRSLTFAAVEEAARLSGTDPWDLVLALVACPRQ